MDGACGDVGGGPWHVCESRAPRSSPMSRQSRGVRGAFWLVRLTMLAPRRARARRRGARVALRTPTPHPARWCWAAPRARTGAPHGAARRRGARAVRVRMRARNAAQTGAAAGRAKRRTNGVACQAANRRHAPAASRCVRIGATAGRAKRIGARMAAGLALARSADAQSGVASGHVARLGAVTVECRLLARCVRALRKVQWHR